MIKTIIFDFGGIFQDLDHGAVERELAKYDLKDFSAEMLQTNLDYEKGLLSTEDLIDFYTDKIPGSSRNGFVQTWNTVLLEFPKARFDFIKELAGSEKYRLFLLSNTNELHMNRVAEKNDFYPQFKACFDRFYVSYAMRMRKPDEEIYRFVLEENDLIPEETLFIDDTPENTESAGRLGINIWNLDPEKEDVRDLFSVKKDLFSE